MATVGAAIPESGKGLGRCEPWVDGRRAAYAETLRPRVERTARRHAHLPMEWVVTNLNRVLRGWGNYFIPPLEHEADWYRHNTPALTAGNK
jgi:hypothetical protein